MSGPSQAWLHDGRDTCKVDSWVATIGRPGPSPEDVGEATPEAGEHVVAVKLAVGPEHGDFRE